MVDPNELDEIIEKKEDKESKSVTEQMADFVEEKEIADAKVKKAVAAKKRKEAKKEKAKVTQPGKIVHVGDPNTLIPQIPPEEKKELESIEITEAATPIEPLTPVEETSTLDEFKLKIVNEFGLSSSVDSHGCFKIKYNNHLILKLLPRKNCRFGVWREIPEEDNKWKAQRIKTDEEEETIINHIKEFIKVNKV